MMEKAPKIRVWDHFVRFFHWGLVLSISISALSGFILNASWITLHLASGAVAVTLVVLRIIWGFWGTGFSRFSSFVLSPKEVIGYFQEIRQGKEKRFIGHNPLGGAMVLALLAIVLGLGLSGLAALGGALKTGPLAFALPYSLGSLFSEIHELLAIGLLLLVAAHLAGVFLESRRHRENLARAMVTGVKERREGDVVLGDAKPRILVMWSLSVVTVAGLIYAGSPLSARLPDNPPVANFDPLVADECSACHMLYHPSLLPAESWNAVMATLDDHFGEDASLDDQSTETIRSWLVAHAAETTDTRPSHILSRDTQVDLAPVSLTETGNWKDIHEDVNDALFKLKSVGSKSNCAACHKDAETGFFSPFSIKIPKE